MYLPNRVTARVLNEELIGEEATADHIVAVREALKPREWTVDHILERLDQARKDDGVTVQALLEIKEAEEAAEAEEDTDTDSES